MVETNSEDLKGRYTSKSKYMPIWVEVKKKGKCTISVVDNAYNTITEAVTRLKKQDHYFRVACDLEQGHEFTLVFEPMPDKEVMVIKLKDTVNKAHKFNLL